METSVFERGTWLFNKIYPSVILERVIMRIILQACLHIWSNEDIKELDWIICSMCSELLKNGRRLDSNGCVSLRRKGMGRYLLFKLLRKMSLAAKVKREGFWWVTSASAPLLPREKFRTLRSEGHLHRSPQQIKTLTQLSWQKRDNIEPNSPENCVQTSVGNQFTTVKIMS